MIHWVGTEPTEDGGTMLRADPTPTVTVFLRSMADGTWQLCFVTGISADATQPEVDDFASRVVDLLEAEPVGPDDLA